MAGVGLDGSIKGRKGRKGEAACRTNDDRGRQQAREE